MEVAYLELCNWEAGVDYPDEEPFSTWLDADTDSPLYEITDEWCAEGSICSVSYLRDWKYIWLLTIPKKWALENIPQVFEDRFRPWVRLEETPGIPPLGAHGVRFPKWSEDNTRDIVIDYDTRQIIGTDEFYRN